MMAVGNAHQFLAAVWGQQSGYVFLPYKDLDKNWNETRAVPYDGDTDILPNIEEFRGDIYFCPQLFSKPKRLKEYALPTHWLWADLDPIHPDKLKIKPTIAWESSPGRFQALWLLDKEIPAEDAAQLSRRIAFSEGADKGGWDVTQVLRIPGSRNHKYKMAPPVKLLWAAKNAYSTRAIKAAYPRVNGHSHESAATGNWPAVSEAAIQSAIAGLPLGYRRRLTQDPALADRSKELQLLARDLIRKRIQPEVVAHILQRASVNKFAGRKNEHEILLKQVADAEIAVAATTKFKVPKPRAKPSEDDGLLEQMEVHKWAGFMQIPTRLEWLVDDAWVDRSVGFISGRSKSYKTWIALDLALSLVSGEPFLGRHQVRRSGPVLLIQEEDPAPVLQERLRLIAKQKGMLPKLEIARSDLIRITYPDYPLHIINLQGFNLGAEEKIDQVRRLIAEINPVAVIMDPLIVMLAGTGADENKATEISMVLQAVKMWREEFGCAVIIVHHWNKGKIEEGERFAQHMYGSFVFHAWLESALHVMPIIEEEQEKINEVKVEREFKAAPSGRAMQLRFEIDSSKNYTYEVVHLDEKTLSPMGQQLLDLVTEAGPQGTTTPELVAVSGHPRPKVVEQLRRLVKTKQVVVIEKGGGRGKSTKYGVPSE
jgi:RecA-family ATPase